MQKIRYNATLKPQAQELRRCATKQENHLWYDFLRNHPKQFRRQKRFDRYIVDFYCSSAKLVIELDGSQHFTSDGIQHDRARTAHLESLGLRILRFTNAEIDDHFESVCNLIDIELSKYKPSPMGKVAQPQAATDEV